MKKALIIGGAGFIGSHVRDYLSVHHPDVRIRMFDLPSRAQNGCEAIDVRKPFSIEGDFGSDTVIFNLAAIHKTPGHPDQEYFETNIRGAENICAFAREKGIRTIVFTSSIAPYGAAEQLKTEETLPTPNTPYGISKLVAEKIHETWLERDAENRLVIVRPGIVFGKGEGGNFTRLYKGLKSRFFAYAGRRDTAKAAVYVKDLVRMMALMAENRQERLQLFNCCYEPSYTIQEIAETVCEVTGLRRRVLTIPAPLLTLGAKVLGLFGSFGLGIHPDRVRKLMISTRISGKKLASHYPPGFTLKEALRDWFDDCEQKGLF